MKLIAFLLGLLLIVGFRDSSKFFGDVIIGKGQMPNIVKDASGKLHLVYGLGDSLMYNSSSDGGKTFSPSIIVAVVPKLAASHTRGPQIASNDSGLVMTVCNVMGDIFSFVKTGKDSWRPTGRVNDTDTVAKENLMALGADGSNTYAVWLDMRDGYNKIFGARSMDGGRTWSKNKMIYASPDKTVCECCKPSVIVKGSKVYVMFRNWINGNRDLYLIQSADNGNSFGTAQKLGKGSWALNGCPMDGGGFVVKNGMAQTVWNRKSIIYSAEPGKEEKEIGKGRNCTMEIVDGKNVYAWLENGEVVVLKPGGEKVVLGKGQPPVLEAINSKSLICVWESDKQVHSYLVSF